MRFIKTLVINLFLIGVVVYVLVWLAAQVLSVYTRHGQSLTLPNLQGLNIEEAEKILQQKKLRYVITDTVFVDKLPKLGVAEQNPNANSKVKEDRIVYLSINSDASATVLMPNLINSSLRYAETVLTGMGLIVGNVSFKPDIAQNAILDQLWKGQSLQPGVKIPKGAAIDLVVGDGSGGALVSLPNLKGLSLLDATNVLQTSLLQLGTVVYEGPVKDSSRAVVQRQNPPFEEGATLSGGDFVDIYLSIP
ncbi:MAG: PASTA domain-containing protein [Bacteroidia bacterium]|nr:PASTA domain-containing protein [Bacteroidia bacterium]MCF8425290.1 PASTA domain-containing protein [Bacteroidia bacterium]MCF8446596.1 PASTA domain-containing protein [Bacteroidia bacterium]